MDRGKVLIFFGPPGSGKGTQANRLSAALKIPAISTGEILRHESESGSEIGRTVSAMLSSGQLVSDSVMNEVVARRLRNSDCASGCILDGYPRTVLQARALDQLLANHGIPGPTVLEFAISARDVVTRLECRRQCSRCGRIFAASNKKQSVCDVDGAPLIRRADDHPAAIRERLRLYKQNASELARYYRSRDYHCIRANRAPDEVSKQIFSALQLKWSVPVRQARAALATRAAF
jgi:adenylate kinase